MKVYNVYLNRGAKLKTKFVIPNIRKKSVPTVIINVICFSYLICVYLQQTVKGVPHIQLFINLFIVLGGISSIIWHLSKNKKQKWLLYMIGAFGSWLVVYIIRPTWRYGLNDIIFTICYMGIGLNLAKERHSTGLYKGLAYFVMGALLLRIVVFGEPIREIITFSSYNFISVLAIFYLVLAIKVQIRNGGDISKLEVILFLLLTLFSYSRAGIMIGAIFTALFLCDWLAHSRRTSMKVMLVFSGTSILLIFFGQLWGMLLQSGLLNKFASLSFSSNGRAEIWEAYIRSCFSGIVNIICGGDPSCIAEGNMHNSFFQMNAVFGFPFLCVNIYILLKMLYRYVKCKEYPLLIITITFLIRCLTDRVLFRGYGEVAYFFIIFDFLCNYSNGYRRSDDAELSNTVSQNNRMSINYDVA